MTIIERIEQNFDKLSPKQKEAAHLIKNHLHEIPFLTAKNIASRSGTSEPTVHRLAQSLGFENFSDMQLNVKKTVIERRTILRFADFVKVQEESSNSWLSKHFIQEIENIKTTMNLNSEASITNTAQLLLDSKHIYIAGWRAGLAITSPLSFILKYILGKCTMIPFGESAEYSAYFEKGDVLTVSGFPRYCKRTLKLCEIAKSSHAKVIVITDSSLSPFTRYGDVNLYAATISNGFLDSYAAPLALVNAIVKEIAYLDKRSVQDNLGKMEEMYGQFESNFNWKDEN